MPLRKRKIAMVNYPSPLFCACKRVSLNYVEGKTENSEREKDKQSWSRTMSEDDVSTRSRMLNRPRKGGFNILGKTGKRFNCRYFPGML